AGARRRLTSPSGHGRRPVEPLRVVPLVPRLELRIALFDRPPPARVLDVPANGLGEPGVELVRRREAERAELRGRERVASIVAGTVRDGADQRLGLSEELEDALR